MKKPLPTYGGSDEILVSGHYAFRASERASDGTVGLQYKMAYLKGVEQGRTAALPTIIGTDLTMPSHTGRLC